MRTGKDGIYNRYIKRVLDFTLALVALFLLSPLLLILTITGAIAMKGNPFFIQERPGKIDPRTGKEKIFKLIKFRTMTNTKGKDGQLLQDSVRLNGYGKLLRKTSLDELPELINIVIGDIAFVGPRPQLIKDMVFMTDEQRRRHIVRPGLTGKAQVNGRNNISWEQKFIYDLQYIENEISVKNDIKIIFRTICVVLCRSDVARIGTESDMDFGDWLLKYKKIDRITYDIKQIAANELLKKDEYE